MVRIWVVAVVALANGCLGQVRGKTDAEAGGVSDAGDEAQVEPADGPKTEGLGKDGPPLDRSPQDRGICSASGVPASCDPLTNTGCSSGDCYITTAGFACVCPAGTVTIGGSCNTTTDCAPTNVCAGQSPPGTCRVICDPKATAPCAGGELCIAIQGHAAVGYCLPRD
jgi:hypothetical protein